MNIYMERKFGPDYKIKVYIATVIERSYIVEFIPEKDDLTYNPAFRFIDGTTDDGDSWRYFSVEQLEEL